MGKIHLVSGGCRSGKSSFALKLASSFRNPAYLATAQVFDEEMKERVERHRQERDHSFTTYEEPLAVLELLPQLENHDLVLWDCLTLWLSNMLCNEAKNGEVREAFKLILTRLIESKFETIIVTNEVGMGIVPESKLARRFRDLAGFLHQDISQIAHEVYLVSMGIPLPLKQLQKLGR